MARRVLVGIDGSEQATRALEHALERFPNAEITALHVIDPVEAFGDEEFTSGSTFETRHELGEEICEEATAKAETEYGRELDTEIRLGRPARAIVSLAEEADVDHVVVGSHGRSGVSRVLLGSVAETVVRRSPAPVTVVR